jgi:polysaccharide chain length determinant protein (PEP-CTERM system associated)
MTTPGMRVEHEPGITPDSVLEVWHRRKWVAVVVFVGVLAATITATTSLPDLYRASATVLVDRQEVSEAFVRPSVTAELETRIQTIHQRVTSRARLADLINRLGLYPELRGVVPVEAIVERMRRDIQLQLKGVEQSTGRTTTISFSVGYSGRNPRLVADVTNMLAGFYVEENSSSRAHQAAKTAEFMSGQLAEAKRALDDQERQTSEYTLRHNDELPGQLQANLAAIERLNTQLRLNGEYQLRLMERRERLEREPARTPSAAVATEPTPAAELVRLRKELAELRRKFSDQYPDVKRVMAEITALEAQLARPENNVAPPDGSSDAPTHERALEAGDEELKSLKDQEASLRRTIADYEARVESAPRRQQEIQQMSHGAEMTKERYQTLLKQYEEAQLAAKLEQGHNVEQFRILDPALPPLAPAAPNRTWLVLMGLVAALALALGGVVMLERLDTTFHDADDLRAFADVPMLATIRQVATKAASRRRRVQHALVAVSVVVALGVIVAGTYYVAKGNEQLVRMMVRGTA